MPQSIHKVLDSRLLKWAKVRRLRHVEREGANIDFSVVAAFRVEQAATIYYTPRSPLELEQSATRHDVREASVRKRHTIQ